MSPKASAASTWIATCPSECTPTWHRAGSNALDCHGFGATSVTDLEYRIQLLAASIRVAWQLGPFSRSSTTLSEAVLTTSPVGVGVGSTSD